MTSEPGTDLPLIRTPLIPTLIRTESFVSFCDGLDHPEGLAFDKQGNLWAGGELGQIYRISPEGVAAELARLGGFCLGLSFSPDGDLWVCNSGLHQLMRVDGGGRVLDAIAEVNGVRLATPNFAVFDRAGNLYFTDSGEWDKGNGRVCLRRRDGRVEHFAGPFAFANGLALSADERSLFVVESQRDAVCRIPVRDGMVAGEPEPYASGLARVPDGLVLDAAGNLYVTCYASDCIYRVSPRREVRLLAFDPEGTRIARPTNAAFGGPNFDDLYIANFGRWHIGRVHLGVPGQRLANM